MTIARWEFRKHFASYLEQIKLKNSPLVIGERARQEFVIFPYPNDWTDLFQMQTNLSEKVLMSEYYEWITHLMHDRADEIHDDLFVS